MSYTRVVPGGPQRGRQADSLVPGRPPTECQHRLSLIHIWAWAPVRVIIAAARDHGPSVVKPLYDAMGERIHHGQDTDYRAVAAAALAECELPAALIEYADSDAVDDLLRASHEEGISLVGTEVGTPVVAVDGVAFFGPVVSPAPKGEAVGRLWDGCLLVAGTAAFCELERTRTVGPVFDTGEQG